LKPIEMGSRVYIPSLGRFLSEDSVAGGNANAYGYPQDPMNDSDVNGNLSLGMKITIGVLAVAAVAVAIMAAPAIIAFVASDVVAATIYTAAFTATNILADIVEGEGGTPNNFKSSLSLGRAAHADFPGAVEGLEANKKLITKGAESGIPDAYRGKAPIELKPDNARALAAGEAQLSRYERITGQVGELWAYMANVDAEGKVTFVYRQIR